MGRKHYTGLLTLVLLIAFAQLLFMKLESGKRQETMKVLGSRRNSEVILEGALETTATNIARRSNISKVVQHSRQCESVQVAQSNQPKFVDLERFDSRRKPTYKLGDVGRTPPLLAVGIPTIRRMNESYLMATLRSMIRQLGAIHRENCVFVVYVAETNREDFFEVANQICDEFGEDMRSQLLEVVSPPEDIYPNWKDKVHVNFGDSYPRSMWRSKQNLDAQFLVSYVESNIRPQYFLLMEDDVIASANYMTIILQTVQSAQAPKGWIYYSFTPVGGAGKVFHSTSLNEFDAMLKIYWNYKPLDWILWDYSKTKVCGYEDDWPACKKKWKKVAVDYGKSLFMHKGKVSSKTNPNFTPPTSK